MSPEAALVPAIIPESITSRSSPSILKVSETSFTFSDGISGTGVSDSEPVMQN